MSTANSKSLPVENDRIIFLRRFIGQHMVGSFSPVARWLNGKLISVEDLAMEIEYVVREDMCNPMMTLHGGIAATILDDIVGTMVYAMGREFAYTSVNLNCDFLNPAFAGDILTAKSQVIRAGKTVIHVEGQIINGSGKVVAKCASNLIQTALKIPAVPAD
jgi:acyl-coenzyme A thioesterase 13